MSYFYFLHSTPSTSAGSLLKLMTHAWENHETPPTVVNHRNSTLSWFLNDLCLKLLIVGWHSYCIRGNEDDDDNDDENENDDENDDDNDAYNNNNNNNDTSNDEQSKV
jgi:hypothetical protein